MKRSTCVAALLLVVGMVHPLLGQDVDAPALVRQAKQTQDWMTKVKSFHVKFDDGQELAFDEHRLYSASQFLNRMTSTSWDGKVAVRSAREGYLEFTDSADTVKRSFMTNVTWGRNGQVYWWTADRERQDDFIASPQLYKSTGRENFQGVDCYVLDGGQPPTKLYVGVSDHLVYGMAHRSRGTISDVWKDYKEVSPGWWYPMTQGTAGRERHVVEIAVNQPLPERMFTTEIPEGTHVHQEIGGTTLDYVQKTDTKADEIEELRADAARRKLFAPPPLLPGARVGNFPVEPLPLNPLAVNPAAEFPQGAKWFNGKAQKLADLRGKVVLIVFWASWQEFIGGRWGRDLDVPNPDALGFLQQDVIVIGVHVPTRDSDKVAAAIKKYNFTFPICIDVPVERKDAGWGTMAEQYRLDELPSTYVIDQEGRVATLGTWSVAVRRAGELLGKSTTQPVKGP